MSDKPSWPSPFTAEILVKRAIQNPPGWKVGVQRWEAIGDMFTHGMILSKSLCEWAGVDPEEVKTRKKK